MQSISLDLKLLLIDCALLRHKYIFPKTFSLLQCFTFLLIFWVVVYFSKWCSFFVIIFSTYVCASSSVFSLDIKGGVFLSKVLRTLYAFKHFSKKKKYSGKYLQKCYLGAFALKSNGLKTFLKFTGKPPCFSMFFL